MSATAPEPPPQAEQKAGGGHPRWVAVLVALGTLVTLIAIFSIWANRQLLNTDNWVHTSDRLLANHDVDEGLSNYIADQALAHVDLREELAEALPPKLEALAGPAAGGLEQLAPQVAERVLTSSATQAVWSEVNRHAHEALLRVLNGGGSKLSTEGGTVSLELAPIVTEVGERVGAAELGAKLPPDVGKLVILRSDQLSTAQKVAKAIRRLPIVLTAVALLLFAAAIWLAGPRRREALRAAGLGFVVAAILALLLRRVAGHYVVDGLAQTETVKPAAEAVWDIGTSLLRTVAVSALAFGILVVIGAWLAGPTRIATRLRREAAPRLRAYPLGAWGIAFGAFVVLVAWAPVAAFRRPLGALILAALLAAGTELLRRQILAENPVAAAAAPASHPPTQERSQTP